MFDPIRVVDEADMGFDVSQGIELAMGESLIFSKGTNLPHDVVLNPTCNIGCNKIFFMPASNLSVQGITEIVFICLN